MKLYSKILCGFAIATTVMFTSCVGDLDVTPIDPNLQTPDKVLTSEDAYKALLAKCYVALAVSSPDGSSGSPDISGIDGGFGQYFRAMFNMTELTTDEAVMGWNDQTIKDLHGLSWSTSDVFVTAMYGRLFYQISLCSEFIRQAQASGINSENMKTYIAEARCLRAMSYYHAIDMFGNVPFVTEDIAIGSTLPTQISRADLFTWLTEEEIPGFINDMKAARTNEYGRADQGLAKMILAKLYLNAEVYAGKAMYNECAKVCKELVAAGYSLEPKFSNLFNAENDLCTKNEIIFSVYQDGLNTQAFGGATYLMLGTMGGKMVSKDYGLVEAGWGGIRVTPQFVDLFEKNDVRGNFFTEGQTKEINDVAVFTNGYAMVKYTNLKRDGSAGQHGTFVDCDIVVFRYADVLLMLAECAKHGSSEITENQGLIYLNDVRERSSASEKGSYTLDEVLDERGRELAWEYHRRSDLIRFGKLTTNKYIWSWKGNTQAGAAVNDKYNLFPIPSSDINSNPNLKQNPGY